MRVDFNYTIIESKLIMKNKFNSLNFFEVIFKYLISLVDAMKHHLNNGKHI